jgi:hypothetical protein
MSFATQSLRYGWVALASLGVLTGTTIYINNNTRHQVKPEDLIQLHLGLYERCMKTQITTNNMGWDVYFGGYWWVWPPGFKETWTSNVYTTNGVMVYTNVVTNTIGWHSRHGRWWSSDTPQIITPLGFELNPYLSLWENFDGRLKALVPCYVDTNTVYEGTTNIAMLTVTGLWASLGIGDGTNKFTREPAWTNPVSTNWIVNYTSYWPSTNGMATNIIYTSDYRQVINYAKSWTATGGHVWAVSSNWVSSVVTVTNVVVYGSLPWQMYVEDLQERYKVLNALKVLPLGTGVGATNGDIDGIEVWANDLGNNTTNAFFFSVWDLGKADNTVHSRKIDQYMDVYPPPNPWEWPAVYATTIIGQDWFNLPEGTTFRIWIPGGGNRSAGFTLLGDPNVIKIWGCSPASGVALCDIEYDSSSVTVSKNDSTPNESLFLVWGTVSPTFYYCTNAYWE